MGSSHDLDMFLGDKMKKTILLILSRCFERPYISGASLIVASFLIVLLASLLLSGCGVFTANAAGNSVTPVTSQALLDKPTATIIPTATIDFQSTLTSVNADAEIARQQAYAAQQAAIDSQNTAISANVAIAQITAQADANKIIIMQATQQAEQLKLQQAAMTMQSSWTTGTAESTILPVTQTAQAKRDALESARFTATAEAPIIAQKMASAKWEDQLGWTSYAAMWTMVVVSIFLLIFIGWYLVRKEQNTPKVTEEKKQKTIYEKDTSDGQYKLEKKRTVVPCDPEQLMVFAKGICEDNMTLAINPWQKTIVHKVIDDLRTFMTDNKFAYELRAKNGELAMLPAGDDWLEDYIVLGDLSFPYTYAFPSPKPNNVLKASPVI